MEFEAESVWVVAQCRGKGHKRAPAVTATLLSYDIEAWCPTFVARVRTPRKKIMRDLEVQLMPPFIFIRARDYPDAQEIAEGDDTMTFDPFMMNGHLATVTGAELSAIASIETKGDAPAFFPPRASVIITAGPFDGHVGTVIGDDETYNIVELKENQLRVKIAPFLLAPNQARSAQASGPI